MSIKNKFYKGNPNLYKAGVKHQFTAEEAVELQKCADDPVYFAVTYMKIVHVDRGLIPFDMWDFQRDMIRTFHNNRFAICKLPRQVGKTTTSIAYLLHYILFNRQKNVAILANKGETAREILKRLKLAYEYLPVFLKQGIKRWNEGSIELANGSKIIASATNGPAVRGATYSIIFLDEFAHVPQNIAEPFFNSTYPTITSGEETKVIIVSTPLGMNKFYELWTKAESHENNYVPISIHWSQVPGRDEAWKKTIIENTSVQQFRQEFECEFIGSTNTLISPEMLNLLKATAKKPIEILDGGSMYIYEYPNPGLKQRDGEILKKPSSYCILVDPSRGQNQDYSAFSIIDVSTIPYSVVARYRNNEISNMVFPTIIYSAAKKYNGAFVLIEINDNGQQVADILHFDLAYENVIKIESKGKQGQHMSQGYKKRVQFGLKQSIATKRIGCTNLKTLIENHKLLLYDLDTINEFLTFVADNQSFTAEEGKNDDLVMTLVMFGWLSTQKVFRDTVNNDIRRLLQEEQLQIMDQDIVPFGFIERGIPNEYDIIDNEVWMYDLVKRHGMDSFSQFPFGSDYDPRL